MSPTEDGARGPADAEGPVADQAAEDTALAGAPELIANSVGDYARIWFKRVRSGESGALPVILGLVAIVVFFQVRNSLFLSAGNLVNLIILSAAFILLGMAEVFVLLLGEIDLSVGYNAGIGAVMTLWAAYTLSWWVAVTIGLGVVVLWTILTTRTRFGRYIYAIGGNAEAARRAGVNLIMIRTMCFTLCGLTAGIGGIILASQLNSMGTNLNGGQYVLFAVAAAVIGGTNLFGGRGRMLHAVLGGLVVAAIDNGLGLIGMSAAATDIVTAIVLLAAVAIDTLARRRSPTT